MIQKAIQEHLLSVSKDVSLRLRIYHPVQPLDRPPVILLHGLLSSSDMFDAPGVPEASLARYLQQQGFAVVTFDQRGAGGSTVDNWTFGLGELTFHDLPAVIRYSLDLFDADRVTLSGHSLGGVQAYLLRAFLARYEGACHGITIHHLGDAFILASPARFTPDLPLWKALTRISHRLIGCMDHDEDGKIHREDFVTAQTTLQSPSLNFLVYILLKTRVVPWFVRHAIRWAATYPFIARIFLRLSLNNVLFHRHDFDPAIFHYIIKARILDAGSVQLLHDIKNGVQSDGVFSIAYENLHISLPDDLRLAPPFRLMTVTSSCDGLIPAGDVTAAHETVQGGRSLITEQTFGISSGHSGYLFKPALYPQVYETIYRFLIEDG
jgi:pimeloyl-ACP methyl ester carboxylesterase